MISFLRCYFEIALLLAIGALALWLCLLVAPRILASQPGRWLQIAALWLCAAFAAPLVVRGGLLPAHGGDQAVVLWSHDTSRGTGDPATAIVWRRPGDPSARQSIDLSAADLRAAALVLGFLPLALLFRLGWQARRLGRWCAGLPVVRRRGQLVLCASDDQSAPFCARAAGVSYLVVPTAMWADLSQLRMVVAHEGCHLRRGDLQVAWIVSGLKALFGWNPAVYLWERWVRLLQEIACDQAVERRFGPVRYGRCLVWAAGMGRAKIYRMSGVLPMAHGSQTDLSRRIRMLFWKPKSKRVGAVLAVSAALAGTLVMGAVTLIATSAIADQRIDLARVQTMAAQLRAQTGFVVPVDDWVVAKLNNLVGARRTWAKESLQRMGPRRAAIEQQLLAAGLPRELLAVAFAESGFDDTVRTSMGSAGIWQFIPATARVYGLEVSDRRDDRLDVQTSTAAAVAAFRDLHGKFADWPLAIAAYNSGPGRVRAAIEEVGSKDVSVLGRSGKLGGDARSGYAQTVLASMLLLANPQLLD